MHRYLPPLISGLLLASLLLLGISSVPRVRIDPRIMYLSDQNHTEALHTPVVISLPSRAPFSQSALTRAAELSRFLEHQPAFGSVHSVFTLQDMQLVDDTLVQRPIIDSSHPDPEVASVALQRSPLLRLLLLSADESSWLYYVYPPDSPSSGSAAADILDSITTLRAQFPEAVIGGVPYWEAATATAIPRDAQVLAGVGLVLLAVGFLLLLRSWRQSLLLWLCACIGMLGTALIFRLLNTPITIFALPLPILILGLSTSYTLHIRAGLIDGDWVHAVRTHGRIVAFTALTTAAGLSGMLFSGSPELRTIGTVGIAGVVLAAAVACLAAPLLQAAVHRSPILRRATKTTPAPHHPHICLVSIVVFCLFLVFGWSRVELGSRWSDVFWPPSHIGMDAAIIIDQAPGFQEATINLTHQQEYYWVEMAAYQKVIAWQKQIAAAFPGVQTYGYTDLVREVLARWDNASGPVAPQSEMEIGEALELARGALLSEFKLISDDYRHISLRLRIPEEHRSFRSILAIADHAESWWAHPDFKITTTGPLVEQAGYHADFLPEQLRAAALFILVVAAIIGITFRSITRILWVLLPPAAGIGTVIALYGLLGWQLFTFEAIIFAIVAGVGVDDAILVSFFPHHSPTRRTVIITTAILCITFSAILFSSFFIVFRIGLMIMLGLSLSTTTVLAISSRRQSTN